MKVNWETDEFGVFFDQIFQFSLFEKFDVVAFDAEDDFGASAEGWSIIFTDRESSTCSGLPSVLFIFLRRFGDDGDFVGNKESGVETDTELTDHGDVGTLGKGFHEGLSSRLGDGTQVSDELLFGHTDTSVSEGQSVGCFVGNDFDLEVWFISGDIRISE